MKILVTGPRGFVGARVMASLKDAAIPAPSLRDMDENAVRRLVDDTAPDLIIHTAAISDIQTCERNPEASCRANVDLPVWLVRTGIPAVIFSSDQVYSGCREPGPYTEDQADPANLYARQKWEMEQRTLEINPGTVLLRAAWMYDLPLYGFPNRGNFLMNMLCSRELSFSSSQHRSFTYVREVADHILAASRLPGGVYNYGSENDLTALETALWLRDRLSLPVRLTDAGPLHALWMDGSKTRAAGIPFRTVTQGLEQCIQDYGL